jgi:hypothetical protein
LTTCPRCESDFDIPSAWVNEPVTCRSCRVEFVARLPKQVLFDDCEDDSDRPRRRPPKKTGLGKSVASVVIVMVLLGGGLGVWLDRQPLAFAETDWREHALFDGSASVRCPVRMTPKPMPSPNPDVTGQKDVWTAAGKQDAIFAFGSVEVPIGVPFTLDEAFNLDRDGLLQTTRGRIAAERSLTVQGHPAKECEFVRGDSHVVYRMIYVAAPECQQYVMVMAGGRSMSAADRTRFIESVQIKSTK